MTGTVGTSNGTRRNRFGFPMLQAQ